MIGKVTMVCFALAMMVFVANCKSFYPDNDDDSSLERRNNVLESLLRKRLEERKECGSDDDDLLKAGQPCRDHYECCSAYCDRTCKICGDVAHCLYCYHKSISGPRCFVLPSKYTCI